MLKSLAIATGRLAGFLKGAAELVTEAVQGHPGREPIHEDVRAEESDIHYRGVLIGGACLLLGMWLATGLLYFYFSFLRQYRAEVSPPPLPYAAHGQPLPPEPRLQGSPARDLQAYRANEDWKLSNFYWLDKQKTQVALPIDQAIQMLAQRGIKPQNGSPNPTETRPQSGTRLTGFEGKVSPEPQ